jgi:hypothetical protein
MLHDETKNRVDLIQVREDRLLICAASVPDEWKPVGGTNKFRQTSKPAMNPSSSSNSIVPRQGEQFLVKLRGSATDRVAPIPWQ